MMNWLTKQRVIIILSAALIIVLVAAGFYAKKQLLFEPHGTLVVYSIPDRTTFTSEDGKIWHLQSQKATPMKPGDYRGVFSAEGFADHSTGFTIVNGQESAVWFELSAVTDTAKQLANTQKSDYIREGITGNAVTQGGEDIITRNPIMKHLPIADQFLNITACDAIRDSTKTHQKIGICVSIIDATNDTYVKQALDALTATNEPLEDYDIIINGFIYPNAAERAAGFTFSPSSSSAA